MSIGLLLVAGGCGSYEVHAVVGTEREPFTGRATPTMGSGGRIEMSNGKGTECLGDFVMSGSSGHGFLSCNDGQQAAVQLRSLGLTSGYGYGTSNTGRAIRFYVGLSPAEGAKYIGGSPSELAGGAGADAHTQSSGTGFFITRQGHMITNAHVVAGCKSITVTNAGGAPAPATVISVDKQNDLAVLRAVPPTIIASLRARPIRPGEPVVVFGFPLAGSLSSGGAVTTGTISALSGLKDDTRYLQISAPIQPGNSGGPLLDNTGAVVGVVTAALTSSRGSGPQNVNFALKADAVRTFLGSVDVNPENTTAGREISVPDVGERARAFSAFVECKG